MYLFGGFIDGDKVNCIYQFNFKTSEWRLIQLAEGAVCPCERAGHSATLVQTDDSHQMYIFGGKDKEDNKLNDMWRFSFATETWQKVETTNNPIGRSAHTMTVYKDYVVVFGGIYEITKELNDCHILNLATGEWTKLFKSTNETFEDSSIEQQRIKKNNSPETHSPHPRVTTKKMSTMVQKKPKPLKSPKA